MARRAQEPSPDVENPDAGPGFSDISPDFQKHSLYALFQADDWPAGIFREPLHLCFGGSHTYSPWYQIP